MDAYNGDDRRQLVEGVNERLDRLEKRIRLGDAADPEKVKRRLMCVDNFREALRQ